MWALKANQPGVLIKCPRKKLFPNVYTDVPIEKLNNIIQVDKMQNSAMPALKSMAKKRGLKGYSKLKKADLIASLHGGVIGNLNKSVTIITITVTDVTTNAFR